jgi:hypothetical protein
MSNNEQIKSFLLFEATLQSIDMIKDEERKQQVKRYFNLWYQNGVKLWKELDKELSVLSEAQTAYEELSAVLYETASKLIESEKTDELMVELQTILNKY